MTVGGIHENKTTKQEKILPFANGKIIFFLCFTLAILALRQQLVVVASLKSENSPIRKLPKMQQLTRLKILFRSKTTFQIMFPRTGQGYIGIIGFILEDATMACNEQLAQHFGQSNATFTSAQIDCNLVLLSTKQYTHSILNRVLKLFETFQNSKTSRIL